MSHMIYFTRKKCKRQQLHLARHWAYCSNNFSLAFYNETWKTIETNWLFCPSNGEHIVCLKFNKDIEIE